MARISKKALIGRNAQIAETAIIHDNVILGDDVEIGEYSIIGHPARGDWQGRRLSIGSRAKIRSHTVIYEGSDFGDDLSVGHSSMIREGVKAGANLQIGTMNDLEGDCVIGDWARFHSNVHISRGTEIGDLVWIFPYVVTTNDPIPPSGLQVGTVIGAGSAICTSSVVLPGARLGEGVLVGAMTRAGGEVPAGALVVGNPGRIVGSVRRLNHLQSGKQHPWMGHFSAGYPDSARARIAQLRKIVDAACDLLEASSPVSPG